MDTLFIDGASPLHELPEAELLVVLPYTLRNMAEATVKILASRAMSAGLIVAIEDTGREGFIRLANRVFRHSRSRLYGYLAQDAFPARGWGSMVCDAFRNEQKSLLAFNDGKWRGMLAAFGVARRTWAEQNYAGDLFLPDYHSHYADVELTLLAMQDKVYAYDPNCVMVEVDYEKDGKSTHAADRQCFRERRQNGFGGRVTAENLLTLFS